MLDNTFIIADYVSIEARVLAWLSGQNDLVADFAKGIDVYSKLATKLFGVPIRKPVDDDPGPVQKYLGIKRSFGKDATLGCGYGMGAGTFYDRCMANDSLRPLFDSGQYDILFISKLIATYRSTYPRIPQLWQTIEKAFRWVIKYPQKMVVYDKGELCTWMPGEPQGILMFDNVKGTIQITLPSGRVLFYPHARISTSGRIAYRRSNNLWGGFLVENIVQAISRDIMGGALLKVHSNVPVVLHSHDELVCLSSKKEMTMNRTMIGMIMEQAPSWAEGLPIAVEIEVSEVYKK